MKNAATGHSDSPSDNQSTYTEASGAGGAADGVP